MSRSVIADTLYLVGFEQWICTMRQTEQMDLEMIKLARVGARHLYYRSENAGLSSGSLVGLITAWSRWQALEDAYFQKDHTCVKYPLTDTARRFIEHLAEHIKQLRRRQQKITRQLLENSDGNVFSNVSSL